MRERIFTSFQFFLLLTPAVFLFYLLRFQIPLFSFSLPSNALEFFIGLLFLFWFIGLFFLSFPKPHFTRWQLIAVIFFLLSIIIATAKTVLTINTGIFVPLGILKGWFIAPFLYYLMLVSSFRTRKDFEKLLESGIGIIALTAGILLFQFFTGTFSDVTATNDLRLVWPYLDPWTGKGSSGNYPAIFLSPFLALAWIMALKSELKLDRLYYFLCALVIAVAVYFTKSYGAWLAVLFACTISSFFFLSGSKRWILTPLLSVLILLGLYLDQKNTEKFRYGLNTSDDTVISSSEERLNIWKVSWDLIQKNPVFGVGPGQFQKAFALEAPFTLQREVSRTEINHALHPHNTYLMFLISSGIFGLLSYLFLLSVFFFPFPKEFRLIFLAPLLYLLAHGMIDVMYWKNDLASSFWFLGGLMTIVRNMNVLTGTVKEGLKIGRELGFPTINVELGTPHDYPYGVYAVKVFMGKEKKKGLLYYGPRKTKGLPENVVCEITILDFEGDLYGKKIRFLMGEYIRGPRRFDAPDELKKQIEKDILIAKHRKFI